MKKTGKKDAADRPPANSSETPAASGKEPYRLLVATRGPECSSAVDHNGTAVLYGEFRQIDWQAPLRLAECSARVAGALAGDSAVVGKPVNWLGTDNGHLTYGVLLHVTGQLKPADLRDGLCHFFAHAMRDAPLGSPGRVPEAAQEQIRRLAQDAAAAASAAAIETPSSISIHDELPIEVWGPWAIPARKPCPDTFHQMTVGWDGVWLSKRKLFVFSGEDSLEVGYDEAQWEARLREVFGAVAQGTAPKLRIEFRTVTMGKRKLHVLKSLEIVPAEERQELALA
jgi:hypothetical protein